MSAASDTGKPSGKTTLGFVVVSLFSSVGGLLLLPLYVLYLDAAEYGIWALTWVVANLAAAVSNLKLDHAMRVMYFDVPTETLQHRDLLNTLLSSTFVISFVALILFLLLGSQFYDHLFSSQAVSFFPVGMMALISSILSQATTPYYALIQNQKSLKTFAGLKVSVTLTNLVLQIIVLTQTSYGVAGVVAAALLASMLNLALVLVLSRQYFTFKFSKSLLFSGIKFSAPLMLFGFLFLAERQVDRVVIENFLSLSDVGIYALLGTLGSTVFLLYNSMDSGFRADLYQCLQNKQKTAHQSSPSQNQQFEKSLFETYLLPGLVLLSALIAVAGVLPFLPVAESYGQLAQYLALFSLSLLPLPILRWQGLVLLYEKKSTPLVIITGIKLLFHLALLAVLLPVWGIWGAILALGVGNSLNAVIYHVLTVQAFRKMTRLLALLPFFLWIIVAALLVLSFAGTQWLVFFAIAQLILFAGVSVYCWYIRRPGAANFGIGMV